MTITLKNYGVAPATAISGSAHVADHRRHRRAAEQGDVRESGAARLGRQRRFVAVHDDHRRRVSRRGELHVRRDATPAARDRCRRRSAVPIGVTTFSVTKNLDGSTPASVTGVVGSTGVQNFRLNRQDAASVCGVQKPAPPISAGRRTRRPALRRLRAHDLRLQHAVVRVGHLQRPELDQHVQRRVRADVQPGRHHPELQGRSGRFELRPADVFVRSAGRQQPVCDRRARRAGARRPVQQPVHADRVQRLPRVVRSAEPSADRASEERHRSREQHVRRRRLDRRRLVGP